MVAVAVGEGHGNLDRARGNRTRLGEAKHRASGALLAMLEGASWAGAGGWGPRNTASPRTPVHGTPTRYRQVRGRVSRVSGLRCRVARGLLGSDHVTWSPVSCPADVEAAVDVPDNSSGSHSVSCGVGSYKDGEGARRLGPEVGPVSYAVAVS